MKTLATRIEQHVYAAGELYHRLVLVVGPARAGKTAAMQELHAQRGWPLLNLNLSASEKLLELTVRQRALRVGDVVHGIVSEATADVVLIDNIEMLFHPDLKQDPLRLLQGMGRNRVVVAAWRGSMVGSTLTYAAPGHPEYRRYDSPGALFVFAPETPASPDVRAAQEPSA